MYSISSEGGRFELLDYDDCHRLNLETSKGSFGAESGRPQDFSNYKKPVGFQ